MRSAWENLINQVYWNIAEFSRLASHVPRLQYNCHVYYVHHRTQKSSQVHPHALPATITYAIPVRVRDLLFLLFLVVFFFSPWLWQPETFTQRVDRVPIPMNSGILTCSSQILVLEFEPIFTSLGQSANVVLPHIGCGPLLHDAALQATS